MKEFHDVSACKPARLPADPTDVTAMLTVLVEAERCAVRGYTHVCNLAAGKWRNMRPAATSPRSSPVRRTAPTCSSSARSSGCWWQGREPPRLTCPRRGGAGPVGRRVVVPDLARRLHAPEAAGRGVGPSQQRDHA